MAKLNFTFRSFIHFLLLQSIVSFNFSTCLVDLLIVGFIFVFLYKTTATSRLKVLNASRGCIHKYEKGKVINLKMAHN
jgi:hypothetical protein